MLDMVVYDRGQDWFYVLDAEWHDPIEYFDFPSSALAFAESMPTSCYVEVFGARFRLYGNTLTFMGGNVDVLPGLKLEFNIKSLNFTKLTGRRHKYEYIADKKWSLLYAASLHDARSGYRLRSSYRRGCDMFRVLENPLHSDVEAVFDAWVEQASRRLFMVVKGHYRRYIERFYSYGNNVKLFGIYELGGKCCGFYAYEVWRGSTQTTCCKLLKTRFHDFVKFVWVDMLQRMVRDTSVGGMLFCGSTADELKRYLGLTPVISYKIDV